MNSRETLRTEKPNCSTMRKMANTLKGSDIEAERKRWNETNLSLENQGGVAIFDAKYSDVKQVDSKPYIIDAEQMEAVNKSVYKYFNTNEKILENSFSPEEWAAYYEAKIEPFAIQFSVSLSSQPSISARRSALSTPRKLKEKSMTSPSAVRQTEASPLTSVL